MLSIGTLGVHREKLVTSKRLLVEASQTRLLVGMKLDRQPAILSLPFSTFSGKNWRLFRMDERTMTPRVGSHSWETNGQWLEPRTTCEFHSEALPPAQRPHNLFNRYALSWFNDMENRLETNDADEALRCLRLAGAVPADDSGLEPYTADEWLDAWTLHSDADRSLPASLYAPLPDASGQEPYRLRVRRAGRVVMLTRSFAKIRHQDGSANYRRLPGLAWAIEPNQELPDGAPLFDLRTLAPRSPARAALRDLWSRRMFVRLGDRPYVRLPYVKRLWLRCPMCGTALGQDVCEVCQNRLGRPVRGVAAVPDLRIEPGRWDCRYTGDYRDLRPALPNLLGQPPLLDYVRRASRGRVDVLEEALAAS